MPCWNNLHYNQQSITSILTHTDPKKTPYRLILVDNGSEDGTLRYMEQIQRAYPDRVCIIRNDTNLGWVEAVNQGVSRFIDVPTADYFMCINNDVLVVQDDWLEKLIESIEEKPWLAGAGPISNAVFGRQNVIYNSPKIKGEERAYIIGFCMLFKRLAVEMLMSKDGFFMDPVFSPGGADEIDVCYRLWKEGYRFYIDREVYVHHFCSKSLEKIASDLNVFHKDKLAILQGKHGVQKIRDFMTPPFKRTLIGIPTYGSVHHKFLMSVITLEKPEGIAIETVPRMLPDVARNKLAEVAITHGYDYLFYIDDDMLFEQTGLLMKFISVLGEHEDIDVISPIAYMRGAPYYPCVFRKAVEPPYYNLVHERQKGLLDVDATTCAATLVRVDAFRRMEHKLGHRRFFDWIRVGNDRIGEDISFCYRVKELLGRRVVCDTDEEIYHIAENMIVGYKVYERHHSHPIVREIMKFVG